MLHAGPCVPGTCGAEARSRRGCLWPCAERVSATIRGFLSAFGYWIGSCIGNVSYWVLIKSTLGAFFPVFGDGNTVTAVLVSSVALWLFHFMILRGIKGQLSSIR